MWLDMPGFCLYNSYSTLFTVYYVGMYAYSSPEASAPLVLFWTVFAQMRLIFKHDIGKNGRQPLAALMGKIEAALP